MYKVCSYNCIQRLIDLGLSCVEIQKQFSTSYNIIGVPSKLPITSIPDIL